MSLPSLRMWSKGGEAHTGFSIDRYCTRAIRQSLWEIELGLEVRGFSVFFKMVKSVFLPNQENREKSALLFDYVKFIPTISSL